MQMITRDKLRVYEKFHGDTDRFQRGSTLSERESIEFQEWRSIDEILHSLFTVQSGQASADFEAEVRARAIVASADDQVRERLFQVSKPKT
jgi:hypothetical protein